LAFVVRVVLAVVLALGTFPTVSQAHAHVSMQCHDTLDAHYHVAQLDIGCSSSADHLGCDAVAGLCCTVVLPASSEAMPARIATTVAWRASAADVMAEQGLETATPPPRT
jgi:hypothetical protein